MSFSGLFDGFVITTDFAGEGGSCSDQLSNGDCHILFHDVGHSSGENVFPHLSKSPVSGISQNCKLRIKSSIGIFVLFWFLEAFNLNTKGLCCW